MSSACPRRRRWLAIAALTVTLAAALLPFRPARAADNSDITVVDATTNLATIEPAHIRKKIADFVATIPADHRLEIEWTTITPSGVPVRFPIRFTTRNAAGQADGQELIFPDWYRHAIRIALYVNGEQDGVERTYDVEGAVLSETPWVKGRIHGVKKTLFPTGKLAGEITYEQGQQTGLSRSYNAAGQLIRTVSFVAGQRDGDSIDYWEGKPDAVERVIPYHKGQVDGVAKAYYLSGQLKWERPFKENRQHGIETQYAADGKVDKTIYWLAGKVVTAAEYQPQAGK